MQFKAFESGIEVSGRSFGFAISGFRFAPSIGMRYLSNHGLTRPGPTGKPTIDPDGWYPQEAWLQAFEGIWREIGPTTVIEIGTRLGGEAPMPAAQLKDPHEAVRWLDPGYHLFHRKNGKLMFDTVTGRMTEGIGHYGYARAGDRKIVSVCENPYPCDLDLGILIGVAGRVEPRSRVVHDVKAPCRKDGAESCTYVITW